MRYETRIALARTFGLSVAALLALLVATTPAAAAPERVTGKLSKRGYTVIALAGSGRRRSPRGQARKFRLKPPAKRVTLHLRGRTALRGPDRCRS